MICIGTLHLKPTSVLIREGEGSDTKLANAGNYIFIAFLLFLA